MTNATFFAFDTETTGLSATDGCEIVSISMVLLNEALETLDEITFFAHPSEHAKVEPKALEINGYTREKWDSFGAMCQWELFEAIHTYLKRHSRLKQIAHNLDFDRSFLEKLFSVHIRADLKGYNQIFGYHGLDTVGVAMFTDMVTLGTLRTSYSLAALTAAYGIDHTEAHTSLSDIRATVSLLRKLREVLQGKVVLDASAVKMALEKPKTFSKIITKIDSDNNIWKFTAGKHTGRTVIEVLHIEPDYLEFCLRMDNLSKEQRSHLESICNKAADPASQVP